MEIENHKEEVPFEHYLDKFHTLDPKEAAQRLNILYDENAKKENELAIMFKQFKDGRRAFEDFDRKYGLGSIKDEDIQNMAYHMKAIMEIIEKYKE